MKIKLTKVFPSSQFSTNSFLSPPLSLSLSLFFSRTWNSFPGFIPLENSATFLERGKRRKNPEGERRQKDKVLKYKSKSWLRGRRFSPGKIYNSRVWVNSFFFFFGALMDRTFSFGWVKSLFHSPPIAIFLQILSLNLFFLERIDPESAQGLMFQSWRPYLSQIMSSYVAVLIVRSNWWVQLTTSDYY